MHPSSIQGVEDMSTLVELHEAAIMHNLFLRYQKDNIYVSRTPAEIVIGLQTNGSKQNVLFFMHFTIFIMFILTDLTHISILCCSSSSLNFYTN